MSEDQQTFRELTAANDAFVALEAKLCIPASPHVKDLQQKLKKAAERLQSEYQKEVKNLQAAAANFLRNLDDRIHDEDMVRAVIDAFPGALKHCDDSVGSHPDETYLPGQHLLCHSGHGFSFTPLLALEGKKRMIFSDDENGGLDSVDGHSHLFDLLPEFLMSDGEYLIRERLGGEEYIRRFRDKNDTEFVALVDEDNVRHDEKAKNVLQQLFELDIFQRKDVIEFEMIEAASYYNFTKRRLDFLLELCPEALAAENRRGEFPIQYHCDREYGFEVLLKAGLKYYPEKLGFLFRVHSYEDEYCGKTTISIALDERGEFVLHRSTLFKWIQEVIHPSDEHPILHDVIKLAPRYFSLFWKYYPDAVYLRDHEGRLPLHVSLQRAGKWSPSLIALININDPIDRHEKDPVSGLYPFMSAASGRPNDLNVIYYLLRRSPSAWEGFRA